MSHPLVVHYKKSPYDVYIGRPTLWGNPFSHLKESAAVVHVKTRDEAVAAYRHWLAGTAYQDIEPERRTKILNHIATLKGKRLACWCAPQSCHGDVLAELANA